MRYLQTEKEGYRALVLQAADRYLQGRPDSELQLYPGTLGHVILLELAAEEMTGEEQYLDRARELADWGIETFWPNQSSLPCASSHHDHYEAITRADTLAMALLELWERETEPDADLRLRFNDR